MKDNPPGEFFDASRYQLPQQDWLCGHHGDGTPCPIGPNGSGECTAHQICTPTLDGAAWKCTRPRAWGGKCKEGPIPDADSPESKAICCHQPIPCHPQRTLRNKRRLVTGITIALSLGCCLVILGGSSGKVDTPLIDTSSVVSPGKLTAHHASLEQGCAACHSAASMSSLDSLACVISSSGGLDDSRKCLECHQGLGDHALHPHSIDPDLAAQKSAAVSRAGHTTHQRLMRMFETHQTTTSGEMACSTCHVEHHGTAFNLKELTNQQCQSCHASSFHSFADGHPEFPERKRAFLYFDHSSHLDTHFPNQADEQGNSASLSCSDCHVQGPDGATMLLARFEKTCGDCHNHQIADDQMPVDLRMNAVTFVSLDSSSGWPPFMEILLPAGRSDTNQAEALIQDLISRRETAVVERLTERTSAQKLDAVLVKAVATRLGESGFYVALRQLKSVEASADSEGSESPNAAVSLGAWAVADEGSSLGYRSRGHADPLLRDWLSLAASLTDSYPEVPQAGTAGAFDRLFQQLAAPEATGRCMKCHTIDAHQSGPSTVNWRSRQVLPAGSGFTRFAHGPHVTLLSSPEQASAMGSHPDTRCESCHSVSSREPVLRNADFLLNDWMPNPDYDHPASLGLNSVTRQSCVSCHVPGKAGDSCLQCHNYHVHPAELDER